MKATGVSVVICCYNSAKIIGDTLACFQKQLGDVSFEILLIDNNSTDGTAQIAHNLWNNHPIASLKIIHEPKPGQMHARNTGIQHAQYQVISFIDDDNHVPANWVLFVTKSFENPAVGILGVKTVLKANYPLPSWFQKHGHSYALGDLYQSAWANITNHALVYGAGMCVRTQVYESLNAAGWKSIIQGRTGTDQTSGDDSEICLAARLAGYQIYYSNAISIDHCIAQNRISEQKLFDLTRAFGQADVNLLPYNLAWKTQSNALRKKWWINYIGKKISLIKHTILYYLGKTESIDYQLIKTRINAFCEKIYTDRKAFTANVHNVALLKERYK
jgi:glycosyltransferase involved in cell wall biosynthesis